MLRRPRGGTAWSLAQRPSVRLADMADLRNLRDPVVLAAFSGWNDAGEAASSVLLHLLAVYPHELAFGLDSEDFYDYQAQRPQIEEVDGKRTVLWPGTEVFVVRAGERDLVLILGPEPNLRWPTFCSRLVSAVRSVNPTLCVTLGCMVTDDPHSRPLPVTGSASTPEWTTALGLEPESYTGPTGIVGVLAHSLADADLPVASLWGASPHYSTEQDCPKATLALLRRLGDALEMELPEGDLPERALNWEAEINSLVAEDEDLQQYIAALEAAQDEGLTSTTGDDIADQFQRYLSRGWKREGR